MRKVALANTAPPDPGDENSMHLSSEAAKDSENTTCAEGAIVASISLHVALEAVGSPSERSCKYTNLYTYAQYPHILKLFLQVPYIYS